MNRPRSPAAVTSLISLDRNGVISAWDAAARRLLAYAPGEAVGRRLAELAPGGSSDRLDRAIERAAAGKPTDGTGRLVAKHGRHVEVAVLLRPVPGAAGVAGVAAGIVDVWAARERDAATARRAAELEARRWARDLHGEALTELEAVEARLATTLTASDYNELRTGSRGAHDQLVAALGGLRRLIRDSDPMQLDELGLEVAIRRLAASMKSTHGVTVDVMFGRIEPLSRAVEHAAHRVVQEALANVAAHAEASHATVMAGMAGGMLEVSVVDTGNGFDPRVTPEGLGLEGIRERVAALRGTLDVRTVSGRGTSVSVALPCGRSAQAAVVYAADPDDPWALLTRRQREVGELAARGHSNLEIAQMLVLSSGTVKTHLSHVYRKLGVSGRTAAAARLNRRPTSGTFATLPIDEAGDRVEPS